MLLAAFDKNREGIINPCDVEQKIEGFPKVGVSCFSSRLLNKVKEAFEVTQISELSNANVKIPVYKFNYKGTDIALFLSAVGAPACVVGFEEVIAMGLEKLVLLGSCGVLDKDLEDLAIIIPTAAIRDEGTSYHYLPACDEIAVNANHLKLIEETLDEHGYSHTKGKTWTTDAPYRETRDKMFLRKEQGCISVEMECASMAAVALFRDVELLQFFYAADNLAGSQWDKRSLGGTTNLSEKEKVMLLAFEFAIKL